jgi:N-hydroxyarylamine O-acetyltransferase
MATATHRDIPAPYRRYLRLLGIEGRPSGLPGLCAIVRRHLSAVPFENISKLVAAGKTGAPRIMTLDDFLDGIEFSDLGGTCYTNNPFLAELLRALGYDADLLGADMSQPDVHTCLRVRIDSAAYQVDVGFAAPFRDPLRLDRLPAKIHEGRNVYVLAPDSAGRVRMTMISDSKNGVAYVAHDPPRLREFFDSVVIKSFAPDSTFMQRLRLSRVFETFSLDLINRTLYRHQAGETTISVLDNMTTLKAVVEEQFHMPRCPLEAALAVLERNTGKPFFDV